MRFVLPAVVLLALSSAVLALDDDDDALLRGGVAEGLKRSPDRYLAAVAEWDGTVVCEGDLCWTPMRVVQVLATRGTTVVAGGSIDVATGADRQGTPGPVRRMVFMAAPIPDHEELFGMTAAAVGHDEKDVCAVVDALRDAGRTVNAGAPACR